MRSPRLWALLALLVALPSFSAGHASGPLAGVPKTYCENHLGDTHVHEYGPSVVWVPLLLPQPPASYDGSVGDCDGDGIAGDPDGHKEYSAREVLLAAGPASVLCHGEEPHHPAYPTIQATDATGVPVPFTVYAIRSWTFSPCQESGLFPALIDCHGWCSVPFPPGSDGLYHVYLPLFNLEPIQAGHVWTT